MYTGSRRRAGSLVTGPKNNGHEPRSPRTSSVAVTYRDLTWQRSPQGIDATLSIWDLRNQLARARASGTPWRLTLNMLLSFAQFEREIAGERIRNKIAALIKKPHFSTASVSLKFKQDSRILVRLLGGPNLMPRREKLRKKRKS